MGLDNKLKVSVIINCHNSENYLNECILSVLNQSHYNLEVIIIDNFSTDKTYDIVKSFSDNRIEYFKTNSFLSLGDARNFGLNRAKGEYTSFLDSDDYWDPEKIKKSMRRIDENVGFVYSDVKYFDKKKSFNLYDRRKAYFGSCFNELVLDYNLCLSSCLFSNKIMKKNKIKFDVNLEVCEDFDFFIQFARLTNIAYVNEVLVYYRLHEGSSTFNNRQLFFKEIKYICNSKTTIPDDLNFRLKKINIINESKYFWEIAQSKKAIKNILLSENNFFIKLFYTTLFLIPYGPIKKVHNLIFYNYDSN